MTQYMFHSSKRYQKDLIAYYRNISYDTVDLWFKDVMEKINHRQILSLIVKKCPNKTLDTNMIGKIIQRAYDPIGVLSIILESGLKPVGSLANIIRHRTGKLVKLEIAVVLGIVSKDIFGKLSLSIGKYYFGDFFNGKRCDNTVYNEIIPTNDPTLTIVNGVIVDHKAGARLIIDNTILTIDGVIYELYDDEWMKKSI